MRKIDEKFINRGVLIVDIIGVLFVILKLTELIRWPWVWVLSPFWIGALLAIVTLIVIVMSEYGDDY